MGYNTDKIIKSRIDILDGLMNGGEQFDGIRESIYKSYATMVQYSKSNDDRARDVILNNSKDFKMICDKLIYTWILIDIAKRDKHYRQFIGDYPELRDQFESREKLHNSIDSTLKLVNNSGNTDGIFVTSMYDLGVVLSNIDMGLKKVTVDTDDELDIDTSGYFGDEEGDEGDSEGILDYETDEIDDGLDENIGNYVDTDDEDEEYDNPEIIANVHRIMTVYKDLFEVGFELQVPYGVLVKEGILKLGKGNRSRIEPITSMSRLYELINDITGDYLVQSQIESGTESDKLRVMRMRKGTTYYPEFQLGNLYGILKNKQADSWDVLSKFLEEELKENIKINLQEDKEIGEIVDALTTCIVISEFDPKVCMKLRINVGSRLLNQNSLEREYNKRKSTILAGTGEVFHLSTLPSGVVELTLVFNKAAFNGRPLFAYEAVNDQLRRGRQPSIKEMILGQDISGKIVTANLDRQNASIILVGAGQRSGKGVLTLNLLGTILKDGHPLIYVDGKPDMAPVLWRVARQNGVKPAVWDAFDSNGYLIGNGAPDNIVREYSDIFGLLAYLKVVQLMMVASHLRATKGVMVGGENKRPFFIFDEALAVQQSLSGVWPGIFGVAKDKKDTSDEAEWCRAVVGWTEQLSNGLASTINSQLPKSGISTVWLFQVIQPTTWNAYKTDGFHGSFSLLKHPLASRMSIKLLGRGTADSEYGLSKIAADRQISEMVLSDYGRNFAYTEAQKINDIGAVRIFKPYLVLNNSETGSKEATELMNNVSREVWNVIAPSGELPAEAGFEGFAKLLGQDAIKNLELGRIFLEDVMKCVGLYDKYGNVDDYIYDASPESFQSLGTLLSQGEVNNGEEYYYSDMDITDLDDGDNIGIDIDTEDGIENYVDTTNDLQDLNNIANRVSYDEEIPIEELEGYDYDTRDLIGTPIKVNNREENYYSMQGKGGRKTVVDTINMRDYIKLNPNNCIDARKAGRPVNGMFEKILINTPYGAQKYIDRLWTSILDTIVLGGYKRVNITMVAMLGGHMFIGKKIVNLDGVLGGYEEVKLRDIVSFRIMFRKFFRLRDLIVDEDMFRVLMMEYQVTERIFVEAKRLNRLIIQKQNGENKVIYRDSIKDNADTNRVMETNSKFKNDFDLYCATQRKTRWEDNIVADNIWGMRLAKKSFSGAGKLFFEKDKPKVGRSAMLFGSGLVIATLGTAAWGGYKLLTGTANLMMNLRR